MAWVPTKLNEGHQALVDLLIANPTATDSELGARLGRSREWVCLIKNSGLFREALVLRKAEIIDPVLTANIDERLEMAVGRSVEVLMEKLAKPSGAVTDDFAIQAAGVLGKMKGIGGYGAKVPTPPPAPPIDRIDRLKDRLLALSGQPQPVEDATILEQPKEAQ